MFRPIKLPGNSQMIKAKLEGDKLLIPKNIIQKSRKELRGCVESSKINPLDAKRIWKAGSS